MTNSFNLSHRPKVVIIHGLNNNPQGFDPLKNHFEQKGYATEMVILPCHGENRHEARNDKEALDCFARSMEKFKGQDYYAIGFSHGALYLQLWMEMNTGTRPLKQILLSPALYIRKQGFIARALPLLPSGLMIMSLQPKRFRRYNMLSAREYNILVQGILDWQKQKTSFKVPTKVLIDPEDELVDAQTLKTEIEKMNPGTEVEFWKRPDLKLGMGAHHILFHPDYFSSDSWRVFTKELDAFLEN